MYSTFDNTPGHESVELSKESNEGKNEGQKTWSKCWNRLFRSNYSPKQIILISILGFVNICFGISDSIGAPFFPSEVRL
jgi:hypothetical protein